MKDMTYEAGASERLRGPGGTRWGAFACALLMAFTLTHQTAHASTPTLFETLEGRWMGWGWLELDSGDREPVKCRVTYDLGEGGKTATQGLRCASATFKIDANASLTNTDGRISGNWRERTYDAEGTISGRATDKYMAMSLLGDNMSAGMSINSKSKCLQSVRIRPKGVNVKLISVNFERC